MSDPSSPSFASSSDPPASAVSPAHDPPVVAARQMQQVLEAIPDAIVMVDRDWNFTFANQRASDIVGPASILGHNIFKLFPGNNQEPFASAYRRAMNDGIATEFEAFHTRPIERWLKVQARPQDDGIIIFFSDVTPRRLAEQRAQESSQQLAQVLELTTDAILSLDRAWNITFMNGHARRMLDPEGRLIGTNHWDAFPAARHSAVWDNYHLSRDHATPTSFEVFYPEPLNAWFAVRTQPTSDGIVSFFRDITEEKAREQIVRAQQEVLEVVQRAACAATWELDLATGRFAYGPGAFDVLGHPLLDVQDLAALESILLPGHVQTLRTGIQDAAKTGESFVIEFAVKAASGATLWIESRGLAVVRADGASRLRGMSLDITQRKLNEQELVASESRYRVLADLNPQAIWMGDPQGNITYANQGFLAYIGLSPNEITGQNWLKPFAPDDRERTIAVWTRSVTTGVDYDIEVHLCHAATGDYRWWHLRAAAVRDASGEILHWLGVGNDIHDAKTYAETLRIEQIETERRRAELESIYRTAPVGLALLDPVDFKFLNLNDREAEMLGFPKEQILGRPLSAIAPPDKVPGLQELMRAVARGAEVTDRLLEGELAARPGEARAWTVNYSPIFHEDGSVRAISTASIEITNQKKAEAALIQSEKLAAVGRLASSISHEINNPLEAITNLLYLVALDPALPEALKIYVHMAQSELSRVSQIATQTLRFHRQAVAPTPVTAKELVDAVIHLYTGRLANSHIEIDARYATPTHILCFENDIRQVLNNLIANAIDAMRTGGKLLIRAHSTHDRTLPGSPAGVRITIADTGHGMSQAVLARLFEPFFTTKNLQGTGLGLWISKGIVERHHGRLRVRSSNHPHSHGTVFTLFLPCA